jgi:hypothetical protein
VPTAGFVDALLAAPVGVTWLGLLEGEARGLPAWTMPDDTEPDAVTAAARSVGERSLGSLLERAVFAGWQVGPWMSSSAATVAAAGYRHAPARAPIAAAIDERFGEVLHQGLDGDAQQWWQGDTTEGFTVQPPFGSLDSVYGAGQFPWAGVWTVSRPPSEAHGELAAIWEIWPQPVSRWRLPVRPGARIVEIHRPEDWAALVKRFATQARPNQECWELPGGQPQADGLAALLSLQGQRAARASIRHHLVPDWNRVAAEYDGVHLSWAGFLTSEGCVTDLADGDVTMLRYWFSERTHWLTDAFGQPEPLGAPDLDPDGSSLSGVDVRLDAARRGRDEAALRVLLGC